VSEHVETRGASGMGLDEVEREALREDPTLTRRVPTSKAPCRQPDPEPPTMGREVAQGPPIVAVNAGGRQATGGTGARRRRATGVDDDAGSADLVVVDDQSWRDELERHSAIGHPIWPSPARSPTPLESLGIYRQLHQVRARAPCGRRSPHQRGPLFHAYSHRKDCRSAQCGLQGKEDARDEGHGHDCWTGPGFMKVPALRRGHLPHAHAAAVPLNAPSVA